MSDKPRFRAHFKDGQIQAKPVVRHGSAEFWEQYRQQTALPEIPKGDEVVGDAYLQQFLDSGPGSPDFIFEPTPSINPDDPRTSRWEYWREQRVIKMYWGDGGTPYYYYEITPAEFRDLRRVSERRGGSPGRFINRRLNSHPYGPAE